MNRFNEIQALCIGSVFQFHCVAPGLHGTVHSVFKHVINLQVQNSLLSLSAQNIGGSSRHLITCTESFVRFSLAAGQPCMLTPDRVEAGSVAISIGDTPFWQGPLDRDARGTVNEKTETRFKAILDRRCPGAGRHRHPQPALLMALGDESGAAEAVGRMVGLGPGLTPAGDDMLLGYIAVYNHLGGDRKLRNLLHSAILDNLPRTTRLSAQMLSDAVHGDYHEYVQAVIKALCTNAAGNLDTLLPRLLSVGASSGTDMAFGMAAALQNIREHREEVHPVAKNNDYQTKPLC